MSGTVMERYALAQQAKEIVVDLTHRTGADYLLAAGMAQAGSPRNRAAISLYRLQQKIAAGDTHDIMAWGVTQAVQQYGRAPHNVHPKAATKLVEIVLHWWLEGVCPHCEGRRFELVPGTQIVSATPCHLCGGRGKEPVTHRLHRKHRDAGRWLADEFDNLVSLVARDMAARLRG